MNMQDLKWGIEIETVKLCYEFFYVASGLFLNLELPRLAT
jgi:hypothetical protein